MTAATEPPHPGARRPRPSKVLLVTAALAVALAAADTYVVVLALQEMMAGVGLSLEELQRATPIVSGFLLGYIGGLPLIGRISDLVPRQRVLIAALGVFLFGSLVTALATELPVMVAGRLVQGIGGGGLVPATLALVADVLPRHRRGMGLAVVTAVQEIGSVLGPLLGAALLAAWSWRAIFWFNALVAVALMVMMALSGRSPRTPGQPNPPRTSRAPSAWVGWLARVAALAALLGTVTLMLALWAPERLTSDITYGPPFVPYEGHTAKLATPIGLWALGLLTGAVVLSISRWWATLRQVDVLGALLVTGALGCVVWTFANAEAGQEIMSPDGTWLLPLALAGIVGYTVRHRHAERPLIDRGVMSAPVVTGLAVSFLVGAALVAVVVEIPVLARLTTAHSQTAAAMVLLRFLIAVPVGALAGGFALRRLRASWIVAAGLVLTAAALGHMATWRADALETWTVSTAGLVAAGIGVGLTVAPLNDVILEQAPQRAHAMAAALIVVSRMTGMVVGLALLTAIGLRQFAEHLQPISRPTAADVTEAGVLQVHAVLAGAAGAALLGACVIVVGWRKTPRPSAGVESVG